MSSPLYVGIDPGLTGCCAVLDGTTVEFFDTPVMSIKVNGSVKNEMDASACALLLSMIDQRPGHGTFVTIEKVAPMPSFNRNKEGEQVDSPRTMGATSAFNFGKGFGTWIGITAALLIPYQLVHPATWKGKVMMGVKGKDAGRMRALQLYPQAGKHLTRKKDHGRADALLLAHFGKLYQLQQQAQPAQMPVGKQAVPSLFDEVF